MKLSKAGMGFLCVMVIFAIAYGIYFFYNYRKFNSEIWRDPNSVLHVSYDITPRQKMIDDVVENILPGSTQDEIESLLGKSRNTSYFSESKRDSIYMLGPERGFGVDSEWLLIWFDDSGKFERYQIATD